MSDSRSRRGSLELPSSPRLLLALSHSPGTWASLEGLSRGLSTRCCIGCGAGPCIARGCRQSWAWGHPGSTVEHVEEEGAGGMNASARPGWQRTRSN